MKQFFTLSQAKGAVVCHKKMQFSQIASKKEARGATAQVLSACAAVGMIVPQPKLASVIEAAFAPIETTFELEKTISMKQLEARLLRCQVALQSLGTVKPGQRIELNLAHTDIAVNPHAFIESTTIHGDPMVYAVLVKDARPTLKSRGRTADTDPAQSLELSLLQAAVKQLYPAGTVCMSAIYYLRHANDKVEAMEFSPKFIQSNFISESSFDESVSLDAIDTKLSTPQTCDDCDKCPFRSMCHYEVAPSQLPEATRAEKIGRGPSFTMSQSAYIKAKKGIYRVLASAGSGKTTVVSNRVLQLLEDGVFAKDILLLSFTSKAVNELKEKLNYWATPEQRELLTGVTVQTFNGFCQSLIEAHYQTLGFTASPSVVTKIRQYEIIESLLDESPIIQELDYSRPYFKLHQAEGAVIKMGTLLDTLEEAFIEDSASFELCFPKKYSEASIEVILDIATRYRRILKEQNLISFVEQMELGSRLLQTHPSRYTHVICDEFQDSDMVQINMLREMEESPYCESLSVIGDDTQAIFSFRGATPDNILRFHDYFPEVIDVKLVENFRSTPEICQFATHISNQIKDGIAKTVTSPRPESGLLPTLYTADLRKSIPESILDAIKAEALHETCIVARSRDDLLQIQKQLSRCGIPSQLAVPKSVAEDEAVLHLYEFAKYLLDKTHVAGFVHFLQVIQPDTFRAHLAGTETNSFDDYIALEQKRFLLFEEQSQLDSLTIFTQALNRIVSQPAIALLKELLAEVEVLTMEACFQRFTRIIQCVGDNFVTPAEATDAVILSTIHSSKGREFHHVIVETRGLKGKDSETLRLFFVAATRAKEQLTLTAPDYTHVDSLIPNWNTVCDISV